MCSINPKSMTEIKLVPQSRFGDWILTWEGELDSAQTVDNFIADNINNWMNDGVPSLWIYLSGKDLDYINHFISQGFEIQRMQQGNVIIMNKWIRPGKKSLPPAPYGFYGVGALVVNKENKILVVRENYKKAPGPWKLPGGLFDPLIDKNFIDTAKRETLEEAGIATKGGSILCQRFVHKGRLYDASDLYSVVKLEAESEEIKYDPIEIADCTWMSIDELRQQSHPLLKYYLNAFERNLSGFKEQKIEDLGCYIYSIDELGH